MNVETNEKARAPLFSIVIPTHNRPLQLSACLRSLTRLNYPRDRFEVVVVDDGSQSPPTEIVNAFQGSIDVKLVSQKNAGPASARNAGAAGAKGQYLAFTDDDCAPTPTWLRRLAIGLLENPDSAVGGQTINALDDDIYASARRAAFTRGERTSTAMQVLLVGDALTPGAEALT